MVQTDIHLKFTVYISEHGKKLEDHQFPTSAELNEMTFQMPNENTFYFVMFRHNCKTFQNIVKRIFKSSREMKCIMKKINANYVYRI